MDRDVLIERVRKAAARVLCGRGLLAAYVFGSRITGSARLDSDLDIGYYLAGRPRGSGAVREDHRGTSVAVTAPPR